MRLIHRSILAAALAAASFGAQAESTFVNGAGNANARLDFRITVPRVLYLRVGTGSDFAANPTINLIDFTVPAASIGNGTAIAASAASGDLGNGAVTARVIGNNGEVTLTSATTGALSNGAAADTISYSAITTAVAALTGAPGAPLPHPTLQDTGTGSQTIAPNAGKIVNRGATWTYTYNNAALVAPGTYGGVNTNNGRVTYTAAMP